MIAPLLKGLGAFLFQVPALLYRQRPAFELGQRLFEGQPVHPGNLSFCAFNFNRDSCLFFGCLTRLKVFLTSTVRSEDVRDE